MSTRADVLIVGGSGPIGVATRHELTASGLTVLAASRRGPVVLDVCDPVAVDALMAEARPRSLVYLVGVPSVADARNEAVLDLERVVRSAVGRGATRIVFASSAAVYGVDSPHPHAEDDPHRGESGYARVKSDSEVAVTALSAELGVSSVSLRIFNVFGPGCLSSLVNRLVAEERPELLVSRDFVRDYVHVHDVAAAIAAAIHHPEVTAPVNIGRGIGIDNATLAELAGTDAFVAVPAADVRSYSVADVTRARRLLRWTATHDPLQAVISGSLAL